MQRIWYSTADLVQGNLMRKKLKVLAVSTYLPIPQDQGDPIRVMMMLRSLEKVADLTVKVISRPDTKEEHLDEFAASLPHSAVSVFSADSGIKVHRTIRALRAAFVGTPPWVLMQSSSAMARNLKSDKTNFDWVVLIGEAAGQYVNCVHGCIVWDKANVLAGSLRANMAAFDSRVERLKARASLPLAKRFEARVLRVVSRAWVTSQADAYRLLREYDVHADSVITSSVDLEQFGSRLARVDPRSRELFWMSSFKYPPNWDGLTRVVHALEELESNVVLRVAGYGASESQQDYLTRHPNVNYIGFVEDPVVAAHGVRGAVVPIWAGAGVKLKTLTLAAIGLPLFATPLALEGLPDEIAFRCSDSAIDLARSLGAEMPDEHTLGMHLRSVRRTLNEKFSESAFDREVHRALRGGVATNEGSARQ
jgi:Glycosyl transferases group 1